MRRFLNRDIVTQAVEGIGFALIVIGAGEAVGWWLGAIVAGVVTVGIIELREVLGDEPSPPAD